MILAMLHGLGIRKQPTPPDQTYNKQTSDAHLAPLGKSYGSYTVDLNSTIALETTRNLPNVTGYLKNVKIEFLLDRNTTANGDFIVAQAMPLFDPSLGASIIDAQYVEALKGRKYITYNVAGTWTPWKEINSGTDLTAKFRTNGVTLRLDLDPVTIREYFLEIEPGGTVEIKVGDYAKFTKPVHLDIAPDSNTYTIVWPQNVIWTNDAQTPPPNAAVGSRLHIEFSKDNTGQIIATDHLYKVT